MRSNLELQWSIVQEVRGRFGADIKEQYDIILRIYAGYDETSVWQEFGEMKFRSKEDIPAAWGNPDPTKRRRKIEVKVKREAMNVISRTEYVLRPNPPKTVDK